MSTPGMPVGAAAQPHRVLIADDNPVIRQLLQRIVSQAGYQVTVVCDGAQAVQAVARETYDAVLMDMSMPVMDGMVATQAMRAIPRPADRPPLHIIGISAYGSAMGKADATTAGMDQYLSKPIQLLGLLRALSQATRLSILRS